MLRRMFAAAAVAATVGGPGLAGDDAVPLGRYKPTPGGFAGAVRSAAAAEAAEEAEDAKDDTELVHHKYRKYYGGYYGGYYPRSYASFSYGYRPYYGGYYGGFYRPYSYSGFYGYPRSFGYGYGSGYSPWSSYGWGGYYRPGFSLSIYSTPRFYYPSYYSSGFGFPGYSYSYSSYSSGWGGWCPVGGVVTAPSVSLALEYPRAVPAQPTTPAPSVIPPAADGTLRYDGGPTAPVPQPRPDAPGTVPTQPAPTDGPTDLPISYSTKAAAKKPAHKYPAYGEKK